MTHRRGSVFISLAILLLAGGCSRQAVRFVLLDSGATRIETPVYSLVVPTDEGWTIESEPDMRAIWLSKAVEGGRAMSLGLIIMELADSPAAGTGDSAAASPGTGDSTAPSPNAGQSGGAFTVEEVARGTLAELEKLAKQTATMGRFTREEIDREPVEIGGRRFYRTICAEYPGGDPAAAGARVSGCYLWFAGDAAPAHYLLINLKDDAAGHVADSRLIAGELPAMLETLRPR